jgi:heme exporter protein CcmD
MPLNLEYVLICYGIWVAVFVVYIPWIKRRQQTYRRSLQSFDKTHSS